jgi:transcriptional regulator with PAS, ATPase and Fis domain
MRRLFEILPDIAASDTNVLINGESGTGKDLFARTIHQHSSRRDFPFVAVNCSALAESLLESELFGHEKAAFTGAVQTRQGRFEMAKNGTLFLDEIGDLKPQLQVKLLRVLEERVFERVGGTRPIRMNARVISATNCDLKTALKQGTFREDFYYRLRTVPITIPPLRERREDIPLLVEYFIQCLNRRTQKQVQSVDPKVMQFFMKYNWPGNVRELERTIEYAFVFVRGSVILPRNLPDAGEFGSAPPSRGEGKPPHTDTNSRESIIWALSRTDGRRKEAAELLGISRTSLWRRMKAFDLA